MGLYNRYILPNLIDLIASTDSVMQPRSRVVPEARGRVLEIGIGSGLNLSLYDPTRVSEIVGVDPAAGMQKLARQRAAQITIPVRTIALELGQIRAHDASFDSIVCTYTLCSIPDVATALKEMRRVLKPGGKLLFCEHGKAPDLPVLLWQNRLTPLWKPLSGGCHLNRDAPVLIEASGFHIRQIESGYLQGPRLMTWTWHGWAD
jgi:ubiquinone/menaquinone biosynthesis C-methylase UbiE